MSLPDQVQLFEVGPREGFQFEKQVHPTDEKLRLIEALVDAGLTWIEATSFVSPRWVPQMVDADELAARLPERTGVDYAGFYLNLRGLERALARPALTVTGYTLLAASEAFSKRNMNQTIAETVAAMEPWITTYRQAGIQADEVVVMAAFGCNYEGSVDLGQVVDLLAQVEQILAGNGGRLARIKLCDTMGWAHPRQVRRTVGAVRERWPGARICLHLHDTRGTGMPNVYAALEDGVSEFETAIGGLGGCPFGAHRGAAGNVPTEDVAFLCAQLGIETGLDLPRLIEAAALAEAIVGHPLPGKLARGGLLPAGE